MKEPFKMSEEFHKTFTDSLDKLESTPKKSTFKRAASVAASLMLIFAIAVFGADAVGVIDLKSGFFMTPAKNPDLTMSVIPQISDNEIAKATTSGVTATVVQTMVCDSGEQTYNFVIVELSANDKILNPGMTIRGGDAKITVPGDATAKPLEIYFASILQDYEFEAVSTVDELKSALAYGPVPSGTYTEDDIKSFMNDANPHYQNSFTDRIYAVFHFAEDYTDKEVCLEFSNLLGLKENAISPEDMEIVIPDTWKLTWNYESNFYAKNFSVEKEYNGVYYKDISITPISISAICPNIDMENHELGETTYINALRLKNGLIQPVSSAGSISHDDTVMYYFNNILDVENISGIFVGNNMTEIPLY